MIAADFDLKALYDALDEQRRLRGMSWAAVAREISRTMTQGRPVGSSTITGVKNRSVVEGDGVLQMLVWLHRTPESFVPGFEGEDDERFRLQEVEVGQVLRWDTKALYSTLDARRQALGLTWEAVAQEVGGFSADTLRRLAKAGRTSFPGVMRLMRWLDQPAAVFTRISDR